MDLIDIVNEDLKNNIDFNLEEDDDIFLDDFFEDDIFNFTCEEILDTIIQKGCDLNKGIYSLEELFKVEPKLENFIPKNISQEDIDIAIYEKIDLIKLERSIRTIDNILPELNLDDKFLLKDLYTSLEEKEENISTNKFRFIIKSVEKKIREIAGKISVIEASFGALALIMVTDSIKSLKDVLSMSKSDIIGKSQLLEHNVYQKFNSKGAYVRNRIGSIIHTFISIFFVVVVYSWIKNNSLRQAKILNKKSGKNFRGGYEIRLLSKTDLDKTISIYNNLMRSVNKLLSEKNIKSTNAMLQSLKSLGIEVNVYGKVKNERRIRSNRSMNKHGYIASDFEKYKKIHSEIRETQRKFTKRVLDMGWFIKEDLASIMDRKALRILTRIVKGMSRRVLMEVFHTAKALGGPQ